MQELLKIRNDESDRRAKEFFDRVLVSKKEKKVLQSEGELVIREGRIESNLITSSNSSNPAIKRQLKNKKTGPTITSLKADKKELKKKIDSLTRYQNSSNTSEEEKNLLTEALNKENQKLQALENQIKEISASKKLEDEHKRKLEVNSILKEMGTVVSHIEVDNTDMLVQPSSDSFDNNNVALESELDVPVDAATNMKIKIEATTVVITDHSDKSDVPSVLADSEDKGTMLNATSGVVLVDMKAINSETIAAAQQKKRKNKVNAEENYTQKSSNRRKKMEEFPCMCGDNSCKKTTSDVEMCDNQKIKCCNKLAHSCKWKRCYSCQPKGKVL